MTTAPGEPAPADPAASRLAPRAPRLRRVAWPLLGAAAGAAVYFALTFLHLSGTRTSSPLPALAAARGPAVPLIACPGRGVASGLLVAHGGRHLVVTSRHAVVGGRSGIWLQFFHPAPSGTRDERLDVPYGRFRLLAVHRQLDLALIDVSEMADELTRRGITPLPLAARDHKTAQGEPVFLIGHPAGAGGELLERSLSAGIVSSPHNREGGRDFRGSFVQVTAAINPGNSGGPIFNAAGEVIAVATYKVTGAAEALGFGLDVRQVHDFLADPAAHSFPKEEIADLLRRPKGLPRERDLLRRFLALGYRPLTGEEADSTVRTKLAPRGVFRHLLKGVGPHHDVCLFVVAGDPEDDLTLAVFPADGKAPVAEDRRESNPDPEVTFRAAAQGDFEVRIANRRDQEAEAILVLLIR